MLMTCAVVVVVGAGGVSGVEVSRGVQVEASLEDEDELYATGEFGEQLKFLWVSG
jgi:hypothetical protein